MEMNHCFYCKAHESYTKRPSKGGFDVALSLVCQPTCHLFGKGQMSLSLFCYNTNVAVALNLCDAVSNIVSVRKRRSTTHKFTYNFTYKFLIASLEIKVTEIATGTKTHPYLVLLD